MAYIPPAPGATKLGEPTPDGVPKQDVHIADLPPEVRKNFLTSMVYFPTLVGAMVCLIMFLGWWLLHSDKTPVQYADALSSSDPRLRWTVARELSENIGNDRIYDRKIFDAVLGILKNKALDNDAQVWSPTGMIKGENERDVTIRWWAAHMLAPMAAGLDKKGDKEVREQAVDALIVALDEPHLSVLAADGLKKMRAIKARDALVKKLTNPLEKDVGIKMAAANALGGIGEEAIILKQPESEIDSYRAPLREAFSAAREAKENDLQDNAAIALARLKDSTGKARLEELTKSENVILRDQAKRALALLNAPPPASN